MVFQIICFSIDYDIPDPLLTYIWTLSTAFLFMQVKSGFDTPILNYILPFLYNSEIIQLFTINTVNHLLKSSHF